MSWVMNRLLKHQTDWELAPGDSSGACLGMPIAGVGVCVGTGSIYASRGSGPRAAMLYSLTEQGLSVSASLAASIYGSVEELPGGNLGRLWTRRQAHTFELTDLHGHMMVLTVSKGNVGATADLSVHFFGIPSFVAQQFNNPTGMGPAACMATAKAVGLVWGITARTEIQLAGISLGIGYLVQVNRG